MSPALLSATQPPQTGSPPASRFRTFEHRVQPPPVEEVEHYRHALGIIADAESQDPGPRDRALLRGLSWTIRLIDSDRRLRFMSADVLEMLHELTVHERRSAVARASASVIRATADRMAEDLPRHFAQNDQSRWQFIAILRLLHVHGVDLAPYRTFYDEYFPGSPSSYFDVFHRIPYAEALATTNYRSLGNYLTYTSFLHFLLLDYPDTGFALPPDDFANLLAGLNGATYSLGPEAGLDFAEQNYFVAHLAMILTNWGESALPRSELVQPLRAYVDQHFEWIQRESDDLVLYAEFVEALRLLKPDDERIENGEAVLLAHQRPDGSWGSEEDVTIDENPYSALHPTWAVMAALRHAR